LALAKVPVPLGVVHVIPELLVAVDPAVIFTAPVVEQVDTAVPAAAVAGGTTVAVTVVLVADTHPVPVFLV
jgi:hypothetical protein